MRRILTVALCIASLFLLIGCGASNDSLTNPNPEPTASATPAPTQTFVSLALTARQDGNIVESVARDTYFSIEAGNRCTVIELPCPRPSRVRWQVSGGFCEILGDITAPSIGVVCSGSGVTRVDATDTERGTTGSTQIQVRR